MKFVVTEYGPWSDWRDSKEPKERCGFVTMTWVWRDGALWGSDTLWRSREVRRFVCGFAKKPTVEYQSVEAKDGPTALKGLNGDKTEAAPKKQTRRRK